MLLTSALTLAGVSILSKAYINTYRPVVKRVHIQTDKWASESPLRLLHLSDIHVERLSITPEKVQQMVGQQPFDLILLTGDYLDKIKSTDRLIHFFKGLLKIEARYGIYAVWGNHDWVIAEHLPVLKTKLEQLGIHVLSNESRTIQLEQMTVNIIGIDDYFSGHSDIDKAYQHVDSDGLKLVITHDPLIVKEMSYDFDYLLCGHLHSGQVYYPLPLHALTWGIKPFPKYLSGLHRHPRGLYYINGGLGQTGANLRLGCRPEITIHTIGAAPVHSQQDDHHDQLMPIKPGHHRHHIRHAG